MSTMHKLAFAVLPVWRGEEGAMDVTLDARLFSDPWLVFWAWRRGEGERFAASMPMVVLPSGQNVRIWGDELR